VLKFRNKYRVGSTRLQTWDYGQKGSYFVTICTSNKIHFFGEIVNHEMQLNGIGKIVEQQWIKTPEIRPDLNLNLDIFMIMPNHIHGILIIGENQFNAVTETGQGMVKEMGQGMKRRDAMHCVSTYRTMNYPVFTPETPIPNNAKSYFTGSSGSICRRTMSSSRTAFASFCFLVRSPNLRATFPE
jgi:putative transposase